MQATLDAIALRTFTRALTCLSKYGDDLTISATPDKLSVSATNSSLSAYCRIKHDRKFFSRYHVGRKRSLRDLNLEDDVQEVTTVTGQLLTKYLLSILKHRTVEKTVNKCELSIAEGAPPGQGTDDTDEENDSLESKLTIRLHCKHGVIKTHRLLLQTPTSIMAPGVPDTPNESRLTIDAKAVRDIIERFPFSKGSKSDPQLVWTFGEDEVRIKSLESSLEAKGDASLSTELTISADEFDIYEIYQPPTTIAFLLREFNATVAFAEHLSLPLDFRFTDPAAPLFIDVTDADLSETLFVISTNQVHNPGGGGGGRGAARTPSVAPSAARKRGREDEEREEAPTVHRTPKTVERRKPMKAAQRTDLETYEKSMGGGARSSMAPPSSIFTHPRNSSDDREKGREPLFLASQLSASSQAAIRESGLGIENMNAEGLDAMLGDGDEDLEAETEAGGGGHRDRDTRTGSEEANDSFDLYEDDTEVMAATQNAGRGDNDKSFEPLFED